jgi:putative oxidoreductase
MNREERPMNRQELETVWAPRLLGILRIVAAILFIEHGTQKLFGFPPPTHGMPEAFTLLWFSSILETFGGFLILIGLFTRPVAFLLSGQMAFAYWMAHAPQNLYPAINGGDAAILFCFLFLYLVAAGPGAFSVDGARNST